MNFRRIQYVGNSDELLLMVRNITLSSTTAAELIVERADAEQEHMGLTSWENALDGKIVKTDVSIAKNYLKEIELADMGQLVNGVLELAERMAKRHIPMTMEDWAKQIDTILAAGGNVLLPNDILSEKQVRVTAMPHGPNRIFTPAASKGGAGADGEV